MVLDGLSVYRDRSGLALSPKGSVWGFFAVVGSIAAEMRLEVESPWPRLCRAALSPAPPLEPRVSLLDPFLLMSSHLGEQRRSILYSCAFPRPGGN